MNIDDIGKLIENLPDSLKSVFIPMILLPIWYSCTWIINPTLIANVDILILLCFFYTLSVIPSFLIALVWDTDDVLSIKIIFPIIFSAIVITLSTLILFSLNYFWNIKVRFFGFILIYLAFLSLLFIFVLHSLYSKLKKNKLFLKNLKINL